jgi:NAD(P)-dependent dehydrogenase (short-subunit alcohol dehydrogenase family)
LFDVSGKRVLVTGGTRGLGMVMALALAERGAWVAVSSRDAAACESAQQEIGKAAAAGAEVLALPADVSHEAEVARLAHEVEATWGRLDVLVNNAGTAWGAPLDSFPASAWDKVLGLNLKAPFLLTQALLPLLEASTNPDDPSRVINVGSIDGLRVPPLDNFSYSASKAGLHHMTRVLAKHLGPRGITVNAIAPGLFETRMTRATLEAGRQVFEGESALGRIGRPEDIAGVVVFLAAPASRFITGSVLAVDGGAATTA